MSRAANWYLCELCHDSDHCNRNCERVATVVECASCDRTVFGGYAIYDGPKKGGEENGDE